MIQITTKKLIRKALVFRNARTLKFKFSNNNNNNNKNKLDDPFAQSQSSLEKIKIKYSMVFQMMSFLKKYFIPFFNPDSNFLKMFFFKIFIFFARKIKKSHISYLWSFRFIQNLFFFRSL